MLINKLESKVFWDTETEYFNSLHYLRMCYYRYKIDVKYINLDNCVFFQNTSFSNTLFYIYSTKKLKNLDFLSTLNNPYVAFFSSMNKIINLFNMYKSYLNNLYTKYNFIINIEVDERSFLLSLLKKKYLSFETIVIPLSHLLSRYNIPNKAQLFSRMLKRQYQ